MTNVNTNLAGPNSIFLNVILAIIAFILIIYLRNIYVTIISVIVVVGVYIVFDTNQLFKINADAATPYIDSQEQELAGSKNENNGSERVVWDYQEAKLVLAKKIGCSERNLNDPNIIQIKDYSDFFTDANKQNAKDPSKTFLLMKSIDCGGQVIYGGIYPVFNASLDGNCFSIMNFTISNSSLNKAYAGFFTSVKAKGSEVHIKNISFEDFNFMINGDLKRFGVFGLVDGKNDGVVFENVSIHLNRPSLITINSNQRYVRFGILTSLAMNCKLLDCNIILSHRFDIYVGSNNLVNVAFGCMCGAMRRSSIMACSVNLIGSRIISNITTGRYIIGLLVGTSRDTNQKIAYLNLLNNFIILKDASLKTNFNLDNYGYLIGAGSNHPVAKNNTISDFLKEDYFGNTNKLYNGNLNIDENNNMNQLGFLDPSEVSITDQIYGLSLNDGSLESNDENSKDDIYWKRVYYIYYEGDTSNMGCRYYRVFNFWKNTELKTYCEDEGNCNTNLYGVCDSGENRRGWAQFGNAVQINCQQSGKTTYTLLTDFTAPRVFTPIILDDGITFNGGNHTITTSGLWNGLFKFVKRDYKINVVIMDLNLNFNGTINPINNTAGGIIGNSGVVGGYADYNMVILNCHSRNGRISGLAGGIVGRGFCANPDSTGMIIYCSNECSISGHGSGGICGPLAGAGGKLDIGGCWNKGSMSDSRSHGGIVGANSGSNLANSHLFIFNSYNTGDLGNNSGGIVAKSNITGERLMVLNCYSTCQFEKPTKNGLTFGSIVGSLQSTASQKPYVIYCDVYFTHENLFVESGSSLVDLVCRDGFKLLDITNDEGNMEPLNSADIYSKRNTFNYHGKYFNSYKLNSLINTLSYEFVSPLWNSDYLTIPKPRM